jgi:hypothetical protein
MDVPFPLAASRRLMSFLTFHISMFFSASVPLGALMAMFEGRSRALPSEGGVVRLLCSIQMCVRGGKK